MSAALPKVLCLKKGVLLKQVFALSRAATPRESRLCAAGDALVSCHRHYRARPTHGIGRFKYLLPKEAPKRRKDRVQMKEISVGTEYEYGDVNIQMTSYDMCLVEHFAQYVHKLCNRLSIRVNESYAMPTKTNEVLFLEERGSKMQLDAVLTTHQRVVQVTRRVEAEEGFTDYVFQPEDLLPILCTILDTRGGKVMFKDKQLDKLDEISKYISIKASFKSVKLVEIRGLSSTFAPILLEIIQSSQPEGVHLLVKEHTEADFKSRLKSRPELEELLAQMN